MPKFLLAMALCILRTLIVTVLVLGISQAEEPVLLQEGAPPAVWLLHQWGAELEHSNATELNLLDDKPATIEQTWRIQQDQNAHRILRYTQDAIRYYLIEFLNEPPGTDGTAGKEETSKGTLPLSLSESMLVALAQVIHSGSTELERDATSLKVTLQALSQSYFPIKALEPLPATRTRDGFRTEKQRYVSKLHLVEIETVTDLESGEIKYRITLSPTPATAKIRAKYGMAIQSHTKEGHLAKTEIEDFLIQKGGEGANDSYPTPLFEP